MKLKHGITNKFPLISKMRNDKRKKKSQIHPKEKINNQDTYLILFKGKLKYPMISHPKRNTNISHPFLF